ncbi:MAG: hypothetical protein ACON44_08885 [Candidatus Puniceispirillaceae bacterium]
MKPDMVKQLAQTLGAETLTFHPPHVWLFRPENTAMIIKQELTQNQNILIVNAGFARNGAGPLFANFMSTLMIEDSHASTSAPLGICSGKNSVTVYHLLNISAMTSASLHSYLLNFEEMASWIFDFIQVTDQRTLASLSKGSQPVSG